MPDSEAKQAERQLAHISEGPFKVGFRRGFPLFFRHFYDRHERVYLDCMAELTQGKKL